MSKTEAIKLFDSGNRKVCQLRVPEGYAFQQSNSQQATFINKGGEKILFSYYENIPMSPLHLRRLAAAPHTISKYFAEVLPQQKDLSLQTSIYQEQKNQLQLTWHSEKSQKHYYFLLQVIDGGCLSLSAQLTESSSLVNLQKKSNYFTGTQYSMPSAHSEMFDSIRPGLYILVVVIIYFVLTRLIKKNYRERNS